MMSTNGQLVSFIWADRRAGAVRDVVLVLVGAALIAVASKVKVPFYPVPMTLQTLAVGLIGATYGLRLGVLAVLTYLGLGLFGVPVFANTPPALAGPAYFLGTTGGFLTGFVALAAIVGFAVDRGLGRSIPKLFAVLLAGEIVMFAFGFVWLAWFATLTSGALGLGADKAWIAGVAPFLLGDLLKAILVSLAIPTAWSSIHAWLSQ